MSDLIPLALSLFPEIGRWLFGDHAELMTTTVTQTIEAATGTADPGAAAALCQRDPALAGQLRIQLAKLAADQERAAHAADLETISASLRDANVPTQTMTLFSQRAVIAWSASIVSAAVLVTFGTVMGLVLTYGVPAGSETVANMLLGTLAAMATSVVSYWVGSSAGSARKEERLAQAARSPG